MSEGLIQCETKHFLQVSTQSVDWGLRGLAVLWKMLSTAVPTCMILHLAQLSMDKLKHPDATALAHGIRACPKHCSVEWVQSHGQGSHQGFKTSRIRLQGTKPSWWSGRRKQWGSSEESKSSTAVFQSCVDNYFPYDTCSSQTSTCWSVGSFGYWNYESVNDAGLKI